MFILTYFYKKVKSILVGKFNENGLLKLNSTNYNLIILFLLITLIGIISIWPSKISIFYGFLALLAIFSSIQFAKMDEFNNDKIIFDNKNLE